MKMSNKENGLEVKVGLFLCIGLLIIGAMVLEFSLGGKRGFKKYYTLQVDLPNANGLLKGSDVLLAGSSIGYVSDKPELSASLSTVRVTLKLDEKVKLPIGTTFKVDSSGLLGDKYVSAQVKDGFKPEEFNPNDAKQVYQPTVGTNPVAIRIYDPEDPKQNDPEHPEDNYHPGDVIMGQHSKDLTQIAAEASKKLSTAVDGLQDMINNLKSGVLSPDSQKDLKDLFASLKVTGENAKEFSSKLPDIAKSAQGAVDKANDTMDKAKSAADNLQKALDNARSLVQKASQGDGLIAQLINNKQLADNFNALVINLREHGVLFYRNSSGKGGDDGSAPAPSPTPAKKRR